MDVNSYRGNGKLPYYRNVAFLYTYLVGSTRQLYKPLFANIGILINPGGCCPIFDVVRGMGRLAFVTAEAMSLRIKRQIPR